MKRLVTIFLFSVLFVLVVVGQNKTPHQRYIEKYASIAVAEMYRTGVPASITLAQGLLESGAGLSALAIKSNNHFGIKCHKNWNGKKVYHDDDIKNECFRAYSHPEESFKDHSDFLRYQDRYKFLFDYKTTDYKSWAYGLKKAGYATDPSYPQKLIKYIEDFTLSKYDTMSSDDAVQISTNEIEREVKSGELSKEQIKELQKEEKRVHKKRRDRKTKDVIPQSPLSIEKPQSYRPTGNESISFSLHRELLSRNGVPYIIVQQGQTAESIAKDYDLFPREIYKFNDLPIGSKLNVGDIVYLQPKKAYAAKDMDMYIVGEDPITLRDISQRFGVKLKSILKLNHLSADYIPVQGDKILLRKDHSFWPF